MFTSGEGRGGLRIGLVRRGFSASGGAESYLRRFAAAATLAGHECVLFCGPEWRGIPWEHGTTVAVDGASPRQFADHLAAANPSARCHVLLSLERVWRCDCYRAGDGVHRAWLKRRSRYEAPLRSWVRRWNSKHREILRLEESLFDPANTRAVIANSGMVKREITGCFNYPADRITVIHNGTHFAPLPPRAESRASLGLGPDEVVVLFAGTGWERKGLRYAIGAINGVRGPGSPVLLVAGRGHKRGLPASGRTRFLGPVADMPRCLAAADIFMLPTLYDPFSNACLEALAAGLPVITTRHNGFSEIIEPGFEGEIAEEPEDLTFLTRAIEKWSDPILRTDAKARLERTAKRHSIEANVDATLETLLRLAR